MPEAPSTLMLMVRLGLSLGLVLALVGGITWVLRRRGLLTGGSGRAATGRLEILDRKSLNKRASLVVARIGGVAVLLGVTDQNVTVLSGAPGIDAAWSEQPAAGSGVEAVTVGSRRTGTPVSPDAVATDSTGMSFVEALRELTVRRS